MFRRCTTAAAFSFLALTGPLAAQTTPIQINNGTYFQDFDSMGTGTPTYPTGWNGYKIGGSGPLGAGSFITTATAPAFTTNNGGLGTGTIYNYGTTGNADRALGSLASGTTIPGFGVVLVNNTGRILTAEDIQISFRAEQWRTGSDSSVNERLAFEYRVGGSSLDVNDAGSGWTQFTALDINELQIGSTTSGAIDGNASGNFITVGPSTLAGLTWNPGERLVLRWLDLDNPGTDAGMAIDNFSFFVVDPVPEPATLPMCGFALLGLMFFRRRNWTG